MNKIALITGATSGIGQATALKAAEAGFDVIITGRRNDRLQELAESIRQKGAGTPLSLRYPSVRRSRDSHSKSRGEMEGYLCIGQ